MATITITDKVASIIGNSNVIGYQNITTLLNNFVLPYISYNSNLTYYIPYQENSLIYGYGWHTVPQINSNILIIPNVDNNTLDISNNNYIPLYSEYNIIEPFLSIVNEYSADIIEYIKIILYSFNFNLMPLTERPNKPYFVVINNIITLYTDDIGVELENQKIVVDVLQNKLFPFWKDISLDGYYSLYLPIYVKLSEQDVINYIEKVLKNYLQNDYSDDIIY